MESMRQENLSIVSSLSPEVGPSDRVNLLKKCSLFADGGRIHCRLLRAIDADMTLARRDAVVGAYFTEEL
jgi:hypothetical protein